MQVLPCIRRSLRDCGCRIVFATRVGTRVKAFRDALRFLRDLRRRTASTRVTGLEVSAEPTLVLVRGLARLATDEFLDLEQLHAGPVARLWPVDELLGAGCTACAIVAS